MEKNNVQPLDEKQIDYNVYNALCLMNEELGESYRLSQFNPFNEGYLLTEEFIIERFENGKNKIEVFAPDFISHGEKETQTAFENSITNLNNCIQDIDEKLSDYTLDKNIKKQYEKLRLYLVCRIQLTKIFLNKMKTQKNTLKMYKEISSLDWEKSKYFEESYNQTYNSQVSINAYMLFIQDATKNKTKSTEDKKLIAKAKAIIQQNLKNASQEKIIETPTHSKEKSITTESQKSSQEFNNKSNIKFEETKQTSKASTNNTDSNRGDRSL